MGRLDRPGQHSQDGRCRRRRLRLHRADLDGAVAGAGGALRDLDSGVAILDVDEEEAAHPLAGLLTVLEREDAAPKAVLLRRFGEFTNAETIPGRPVPQAELAPDEAMAALMGRFNEAT